MRWLLFVLLVLGVGSMAWLGYLVEWTGFDATPIDPQTQPRKALWDWLDLLIVPAVLGVGLWYLNGRQTASARRIEVDRQRHAALDDYIAVLSQLMLDYELGTGAVPAATTIARTRTLNILRMLDGDRKGDILQFLAEAGLLSEGSPRIKLLGADLRDANLQGAVLNGIVLRGANLDRANLRFAKLRGSNLCGSTFRRADMTGATLDGAKLRTASLEDAILEGSTFVNACTFGIDVKLPGELLNCEMGCGHV